MVPERPKHATADPGRCAHDLAPRAGGWWSTIAATACAHDLAPRAGGWWPGTWLVAGALVFVAAAVGFACAPSSDAAPDAEVAGPLAVVRGHVDAFNRHDAEDLLAWVSPAVEWVNVRGSVVSVEVRGRELLRDYMATYFEAQPTVRSEIEDAVVTGDFVAVRERASWTAPDGEDRSQASLAVYQVRDGLIQRVWYYPVVP